MHRVKDIFEIKKRTCPDHDEGTVAVIDWDSAFSTPSTGSSVIVRRPDGTTLKLEVAEIKDHGPAISLFFKGLTLNEIPRGSLISFM